MTKLKTAVLQTTVAVALIFLAIAHTSVHTYIHTDFIQDVNKLIYSLS